MANENTKYKKSLHGFKCHQRPALRNMRDLLAPKSFGGLGGNFYQNGCRSEEVLSGYEVKEGGLFKLGAPSSIGIAREHLR